jgi:hypothetical protein
LTPLAARWLNRYYCQAVKQKAILLLKVHFFHF